MTQQVPQPPRLAGYSYVRVLGHGSTATVYLYRQQGIERDVAIKVSVEQVDSRIADAFRAEARAMAALSSHPYILSTYDAGVTDDGRYYLVFEYAPGGTLKDVLCNHVLDVPQMLSMGVHLASAVATAHRAGIVHRDIKTSNVLITWQRLPTLADFGIAVTAYDHSSTGYSLPWLLRRRCARAVREVRRPTSIRWAQCSMPHWWAPPRSNTGTTRRRRRSWQGSS